MEAFASTPPAVSSLLSPPFSALASDGPFSSLGSQWPPTFSWVCFTAAHAVRAARDSSWYSSCAESYACANVSCAFSSERRSVDGISSWRARPFFFAFGTVSSCCRGCLRCFDSRNDDAARPTLSGPSPPETAGRESVEAPPLALSIVRSR